jgi:hypothetical protein
MVMLISVGSLLDCFADAPSMVTQGVQSSPLEGCPSCLDGNLTRENPTNALSLLSDSRVLPPQGNKTALVPFL